MVAFVAFILPLCNWTEGTTASPPSWVNVPPYMTNARLPMPSTSKLLETFSKVPLVQSTQPPKIFNGVFRPKEFISSVLNAAAGAPTSRLSTVREDGKFASVAPSMFTAL